VEFVEFTGNVSSVAIQNWGISSLDLTWVVQNDDLSIETGGLFGWVVLTVTSNITSLKVLNWDVFNVETNIVSWDSFSQRFVMHFD